MIRDVILCFVGLIVSPLLTGMVCSIVRLAAVPSVVVEHGSLDLNCFLTNEANTRNLSRFYVDGKDPVQVVLLQNGSCLVIDAMNIALNQSCVNRNNFTITLGNVSRLLHGKTCRCTLFPSGHELSSDNITINVSVPVGGVEIINVSKTSMSIAANHWTTLQCKTLPSRPVATVKWTIEDTLLYSSNSTTEQTTDELTVVTSVLSLFPNKSMNGKKLFCSANNYMDINHYDWVFLNVTYPPDRPVTIEGLQNGHTVSIIENKSVSLNCTIGESNPPVNLNWSCTDVAVFKVSDWNYTAKLVQIQASRHTKPVCNCTSTYPADNPDKSEKSVSFDVLYPATISKLFSGGFNISKQQLIVIENDSVHVRCEAEGNPTPTFRWTLENEHYSYSQNITLNNVKRNTATTRYSCIASNVMNDSTGSSYQGNDNTDFTLIVLYPPRIHALHNVNIIEGKSTFVNCTIIPGNPSEPTDVRWIHVPEKQSVLYFNKVNRTDSGLYTCVANNTMNTSYGDIRVGIDNQTIDIKVLYPPEEITIVSTTEPNHKMIDNISLIENTSLELICSAKGNPMPSFYSWYGIVSSDNPRVYVYTSKTNRGGNITCLVKNVMTELPQNITYNGTIKKTLLVDVLYPPEIENIQYKKVIEGQDYKIDCLKTSGKTTFLSVKWMKDNNETSGRPDSSLIISNVSRNRNGRYDCFIQYKMEPTYGQNISGNINNSCVLDVLYPPELLNISLKVDSEVVVNITRSVSVIENASLVLNCSSLGNPLPSSYTWTGHQTYVHSATLPLKVTRNSRGIFICTAKNKMDLSNGTSVTGQTSQSFEIDVQYPPELKGERYIATPEGKDVTMTCIRDYGRTVYLAVRWINSNGTTMQEFDNLTLVNVTRSSSGNYTCETSYTMAPSYRQPITAFMAKTVYFEVTYAIYDGQNTALGGDNAGPVAVGVIGGIIGIGAIVAAVFLIRRRFHGNQLNAAKQSSDETLSQVCQYELKDSDCKVTAGGENYNVYEKLKNADGMCAETADGGISNIYEKLQNAGSDQQYQQLKPVDLMDNNGQRVVYENLRI